MMSKRAYPYILAAAVWLITLAAFLPALQNGFVVWDDNQYIYENTQIRSLSWETVRWALTDTSLIYWNPLAKLSHALDHALWGLNAAGHHLTSLFLHAVNALLVVLLVLRSLAWQGAQGRTATLPAWLEGTAVLIAAGVAGILFGLHPIHVEPAVWISARKELLCTLFYLLSILAYLEYSRRGQRPEGSGGRRPLSRDPWYLASLGLFMLALASKPMAVSLPAVLLLLDWHPFGRLRSLRDLRPLLAEKIPFIVPSLAVSIVTAIAQHAVGAMDLVDASLATRLMVAVQAVAAYLGKILVPLHLNPLYPYPKEISAASLEFLMPALTCAVISAGCIVAARRNRRIWPLLWVYYLVTLLPALGLVQVGRQSMGDRFVYLPSIAPFLAAGLGAAWLWTKSGALKQGAGAARLLAAGAAAVIGVSLIILTQRQITVWKTSIDLWDHVISLEPDRIPIAYNNRGIAWGMRGEPDRAIADYTKALSLDPALSRARLNRGIAYNGQGQRDLAIEDFSEVIRQDPGIAEAYGGRGLVFAESGDLDRAMGDYSTAIRLDPAYHRAYYNRGLVFLKRRQLPEAREDFSAAINLHPGSFEAYNNRGLVLVQLGELDRAVEDYSRTIALNHNYAEAYNNRGVVYKATGRMDDAIVDFSMAITLKPDYASAQYNRGVAFQEKGQFDRAIDDLTRAISLDPRFAGAYNNRGIAYVEQGLPELALKDFTTAIGLQPGYFGYYLNRGELLRQSGRTDRARQDFRKACDLGSEAGCRALRAGP
jgi:protein O-mannosyl-transferase